MDWIKGQQCEVPGCLNYTGERALSLVYGLAVYDRAYLCKWHIQIYFEGQVEQAKIAKQAVLKGLSTYKEGELK